MEQQKLTEKEQHESSQETGVCFWWKLRNGSGTVKCVENRWEMKMYVERYPWHLDVTFLVLWWHKLVWVD